MRKVILGLAVSLDGYIEGPQGEYDWCFTDQDYGMSDFFSNVDAAFMGRRSYEMTQAMGDAANAGFPNLKRYVFSNTLEEVEEGALPRRGQGPPPHRQGQGRCFLTTVSIYYTTRDRRDGASPTAAPGSTDRPGGSPDLIVNPR